MPRVATVAALFIVLLVAALWLWSGASGEQHGVVPSDGSKVHFETLVLVTQTGSHTLKVEVARTRAEQALGLMYRTELAQDHGMLFIHEPIRLAQMWMKNTYIPLDMVFISADGTVANISRMTEPHSEALITSGVPVKAVLEIAGGAARTYGLKPGDKVRHKIFEAR